MEKTKIQTQEFITKDMTIGEVVNKYPLLADIMTSYGLHCVGCHVNPYETIEQGVIGHGMDEETLDRLMNDLNDAVKDAPEEEKKFIITEKAVVRLREFMKKEGKENVGLRLGILESGGCCGGVQYTLEFADSPESNESKLNNNGIDVFVDKMVLQTIMNLKIDYVEDEHGSGFKIDSEMKESGGCGSGCGCSH